MRQTSYYHFSATDLLAQHGIFSMKDICFVNSRELIVIKELKSEDKLLTMKEFNDLGIRERLEVYIGLAKYIVRIFELGVIFDTDYYFSRKVVLKDGNMSNPVLLVYSDVRTTSKNWPKKCGDIWFSNQEELARKYIVMSFIKLIEVIEEESPFFLHVQTKHTHEEVIKQVNNTLKQTQNGSYTMGNLIEKLEDLLPFTATGRDTHNKSPSRYRSRSRSCSRSSRSPTRPRGATSNK